MRLRAFFLSPPARALGACALLCAAFLASAQQFRWVDEKGRVQYTDTPPPPSAKSVVKKSLRSESIPDGQEPFALQTARKNYPVKLYSAPDCGAVCDEARALLSQRGVPFSEVSVTQTAQIEELKKVSGSGIVPVLVVGAAVQKGFEAQGYQQALDAAGYPKTGAPRPAAAAASKAPKTPAAPPSASPAPTPSDVSKDAKK